MAFSEKLKISVRRRAHGACCICRGVGVEVHHIVPQEDDGPDTEENAAPLCPSCHEMYGANSTKRKLIREMRDIWYELCEKRYASEAQLSEIRQLLASTVTKDAFDDFTRQVLAQLSGEKESGIPHRIGGQMERGESPSGLLEYELRGEERINVEIWMWEKDQKASALMLCRTEGWGYLRVHFAPDDSWVLVEDGGLSLGVESRLFLRVGGASFEEMATDIGDKRKQWP